MRVELRSKLIEAASYDEDSRFLRVFLTNGQLREFINVPRDVFEDLVAARSAGTYYMQQIRGRFASPED